MCSTLTHSLSLSLHQQSQKTTSPSKSFKHEDGWIEEAKERAQQGGGAEGTVAEGGRDLIFVGEFLNKHTTTGWWERRNRIKWEFLVGSLRKPLSFQERERAY